MMQSTRRMMFGLVAVWGLFGSALWGHAQALSISTLAGSAGNIGRMHLTDT